ncbi:MAG: DUF805 domain-containing protein [Erythrobacter sp.]|nr:DUF805 domain-containing protein [Erythrobacter sp.]
MAFPVDEKPRVGRKQYWILFGVNIVAMVMLVVGAVAALMAGEFLTAGLAFLLIVPVGIYFRVVMMRRCRDIGWPPSLPWIMFGLGMVASWYSLGSTGSGVVGMEKPVGPATGGMGLSWLVSMADFVLMIVLGCIRSRDSVDYQEVFGGYASAPAPQRTMPKSHRGADPRPQADFGAPRPSVASGDSDAMDDAIARALDNYRRTGSAVPEAGQQGPLRQRGAPAPAPAQQLRVGGFGRKVV